MASSVTSRAPRTLKSLTRNVVRRPSNLLDTHSPVGVAMRWSFLLSKSHRGLILSRESVMYSGQSERKIIYTATQ
jgi:hypothetical protein